MDRIPGKKDVQHTRTSENAGRTSVLSTESEVNAYEEETPGQGVQTLTALPCPGWGQDNP